MTQTYSYNQYKMAKAAPDDWTPLPPGYYRATLRRLVKDRVVEVRGYNPATDRNLEWRRIPKETL